MTDMGPAAPLSRIRRIIAARMTEASQTIPHFRLSAYLDVDALLALRRSLGAANRREPLSLNDLLLKACAAALMQAPEVNVQWTDAGIQRCPNADISVVVALNGGGLSTPIIRRAQSKSVFAISREAKALAARAAKNALNMQEIVGGSFSVSNLGAYGVDRFDAIINPPQCAILAVGAAKPRLVVSAEGDTRVATVMTVTLSCDHRAIDGAVGAQFLSALRQQVEQPAAWSAEADA